MAMKQYKLACFNAITNAKNFIMLSFLNNWKWEMLYEKQNVQGQQ